MGTQGQTGNNSIRQEKMPNDMAIGNTTINVRGIGLYVAIEQGDGSGPPLLLINGIGANLEFLTCSTNTGHSVPSSLFC